MKKIGFIGLIILFSCPIILFAEHKDHHDSVPRGPKGDRGDKGDRGSKGEKGDRGPKGPKGDKGEKGKDGKDGKQGPKGDRGPAGRDGRDGVNGEDGKDGLPGEKGDPGKDADMTKVNANTSLALSNQQKNMEQDGRLNKLEEVKWLLDLEVLVADSKHLAVSLYNSYDWRHRRNHAIGMKFLLKVGKSYEERQIEKLERMIRELQLLAHPPNASKVLYFQEKK